jgi:hypothetical protein
MESHKGHADNSKKSLTLVGKQNERNALFHYYRYQKHPSGVVNA